MDQEIDQQPEPPEGEQNHREVSRRALPWFCWLALLPLVYVLSLGPAYKLHYAGWLPVDIRSLYRPLEWLADRSRPINRFLGWYIYNVWRCPTVRI